MDKHIPEFTPEQVDAQVDWLLTRQAPASPDKQIISGLHQMYQDDERSLNNVWQRLGLEQDQASNRETQQLPWEETPTAQLLASANILDLKRKRSMRQLIETTRATRQSAKRTPARVF